MPGLGTLPSGCAFHPRCDFATDVCKKTMPEFINFGDVKVACHEVARLHQTNKNAEQPDD